MSALVGVSTRRRTTDRVMRGLTLAGTIVALVPLVLVIYYLLKRGLGAWSWDFFTTDPTGNFFGDQGGIKSALLGTIEIVVLASLTVITHWTRRCTIGNVSAPGCWVRMPSAIVSGGGIFTG